MDESDERRQLRDLVARRWGALLKWLALLVAGIAVVVILVSLAVIFLVVRRQDKRTAQPQETEGVPSPE
jgi:heme/copper-type cytochrome/quinol oxidase subunit 2